ncbi:hypothetical protein BDQ17DRAFT_218727 [Cyathus striatus]|nr:hypothetical protein BDQ17DRAFT_218727 [Cyathus striatus]
MPPSEVHPSEGPLPTLQKLGIDKVPDDLDVSRVVKSWLTSFATALSSASADAVVSLLVPSTYDSALYEKNDPNVLSSYWRDILAFTWDFRTFEGAESIGVFLQDQLAQTQISNVALRTDYTPQLIQPYPDLLWIQGMFSFHSKIGLCSGLFRLVPFAVADGPLQWKAHTILTALESLHDFPELSGPLRNANPDHGHWEKIREQEAKFEDSEPTVLIVGGGHSGLEVAARLKALGVSSLIVERNKRIGDNWRNRYEALCLHDPVWYDHMPYIPFPSTWPVYTPARKLALWLEQYATSMEINIWTSSTVTHASQDPNTLLWDVTVAKEDGIQRIFRVKHLVFAMGFKGGEGYIPKYPGMDTFKGKILHSLQHDKATDHAGKKIVVIGSCTSAHDICTDYYEHGIDVTMYQRSSTYVMSTKNGLRTIFEGLYDESGPSTEIADIINASFPNMLNVGMAYRSAKRIAEADKQTLDGLVACGFRTNMGVKDTGFFILVWGKAGGYYLDVGASQLIIDGKIKLKNDSLIQTFTEDGLKFENGSELPADVVVFCTGLGDPRDGIRRICGDDVAERCNTVWGLNDEGEINGIWRDMGYKGLWYVMGNFALCRFHSKHIALQIKAIEEGLFGRRYSRNP